jgi:hypothetical protein
MDTIAEVWIDHRKAVIRTITGDLEKTLEVRARMEPERREWDRLPPKPPSELTSMVTDEDSPSEFRMGLDRYYADVVEAIGDVMAVLIFGPGGAKGELRHCLIRSRFAGQVRAMEPSGLWTDRQLAARARDHLYN